VGYAYEFFRDPFGFVGSRFDRYGDVYYAPSGDVGLYVVRHPDDVRDVLVTHADAFEKTHSAFDRLGQVLGQGLLTTDGEVWRKHRRIMNPAFAKKAIHGYVPLMVTEAERSVAELARTQAGVEIDIDKQMVDLTLRIVGRTLLGIDVASEVDRVGNAMQVFQTALAVPGTIPKPLLWPVERRINRAKAELDDVIHKVIDARRKAPRGEPDLLQMLLDAVDPEDASVRLSEQEIRDELVTFLLAGHETTSNTLTWALYLLSQSPEAEQALQAELARVPDEESPELLVYSEQVVKEAMRLYPPAYVLARKASRDTTIGRYSVPKGSEVVVWTYFTHRDPRFYPDPTAFRPERFAAVEEAKLPKQAYLPFGAGPRACIGKMFAQVEATVVLAVLARSLRFRYAKRKPPKPQPRITLGPAGGMPMLVCKR
jgi:cytochrome P450